MPTYFLDTSALVKYYVIETGTPFVQALFDPAGVNDLIICWISRVEVVAAVTRRSRGASLAAADASRIIREFRLDFTTEFRLIDVNPALLDHATTRRIWPSSMGCEGTTPCSWRQRLALTLRREARGQRLRWCRRTWSSIPLRPRRG